MRYELHNRDGKVLGRVDLEVPPVELVQSLQHTAVILGPAICDVLAPLPEEATVPLSTRTLASPAEAKRLSVTPVALAVAPKVIVGRKKRSKLE
jgi:hypothetical protein